VPGVPCEPSEVVHFRKIIWDLENIDYKYNIRGWLTEINNHEANEYTGSGLFNMKIRYNEVGYYYNYYNQPSFNVNISHIILSYRGDDRCKINNYFYDKLNRLMNKIYTEIDMNML